MYNCAICNIEMSDSGSDMDGMTIDHIIPVTKNGSKNLSNTQWVCRRCNGKKSNNFSHTIKIWTKTDFNFLKKLISNEMNNNLFDKPAME